MVSCARCGRCLTWEKSIDRGYGPICWQKRQLQEAREEALATPENLALERKMIVTLNKASHVELSSTSSQNARRRERYYIKRGFRLIKDFSYHSYDRLLEKIENRPQDQFIAVCYDEISQRDEKNKAYSRMTISLLVKENCHNNATLENYLS